MFSHSTRAWLLTFGCLITACSDPEDPIETAVIYLAAGTDETTALAGFYGETQGLNRCLSDIYDRCIVTTCLDGGSSRIYVDGGEVEFQGDELEATLDTGSVPDASENPGPGLAVLDGLPVLSDGEELSFRLLGRGRVPATEGSLTMPERLTLTAPELSEPGCASLEDEARQSVVIDAAEDFEVTWSTNESNDIDIIFRFDDIVDYAGEEDRERFTTVRCLYTAEEERSVIPEEVVERMPTKVPGYFTIRQLTSTAKVVDNWAVTFGAYWQLCSPAEVQ